MRREVSANKGKDFARNGGLARAEQMKDSAAQKNSSVEEQNYGGN